MVLKKSGEGGGTSGGEEEDEDDDMAMDTAGVMPVRVGPPSWYVLSNVLLTSGRSVSVTMTGEERGHPSH